MSIVTGYRIRTNMNGLQRLVKCFRFFAVIFLAVQLV